MVGIIQESRQILMDETLGDEEVLTNAKIYEIIDLTKQRMVEEKDVVIENKDLQLSEKDRKIAEYKEMLNKKNEEDKEKAKRRYEKSEKLSHVIHVILGVILSLIFCSGQYIFIQMEYFSIPMWCQILLYVFYASLFPLLSFWGAGIIGPIKKSKLKLAEIINNYFSR